MAFTFNLFKYPVLFNTIPKTSSRVHTTTIPLRMADGT